MEIKIILCLLATVAVHTRAQGQEEGPLQTRFLDPTDRHVELGAEIHLDCEVNRGPLFGLRNKVNIIRQSMVNGQLVSTQLSNSGQLSSNASPTYYDVDIDTSIPQLTIHFKIKKVQDIDDATYLCKAIDQDNNLEANTSLKVVVLRENQKLHLKFGDNQPISESMQAPFEVDAGKYPLTCISEGSNPATSDIHAYWNGEELEVSSPVIEAMDTPLVRYRTTVTGEAHIDVSNSGQNVECMARSKAGDQHTIKAPIKVNVYDPTVECTDNTAFVGKRYPVLSCTVDITGHEIESYAYESGKTGTIIKAGDQSADFDEVVKTDLGDSKVQVDLKLHRVKDTHFSEYYLIITQTNGHMTKAAVVLSEVEGNGNEGGSGPEDSSTMLGASLTTFTLCVVCAVWKTL